MFQEYLSNLYVKYYYGGLIALDDHWRARDTVCPYSKVYYITKGECVIEIEGTRYDAKPGDFFLIPAGIRHSFRHENENYITKYWFHFDFKLGGQHFNKTVSAPYFHHFSEDKQLIAMFRKIFRLEKQNSPASTLEITATMLQMMAHFFGAATAQASDIKDESDAILRKVIHYIHRNRHKTITVEELAALTDFHPNYFVRFFKEKLGIPPVKYVNNLKIEVAKSLLETTDMSVLEVMHSVGFSDYSHFSKYFKNYCGSSPKTFRRYYTK